MKLATLHLEDRASYAPTTLDVHAYPSRECVDVDVCNVEAGTWSEYTIRMTPREAAALRDALDRAIAAIGMHRESREAGDD